MALFTCQNVTVGYEGKAVAKNLNFTINSGDYLCIVGENGTGKSTLLKTLCKLKNPIDGSILAGETLKASDLGYLPQQTELQKDFPATVKEIVQSGCLNKMGFRPIYNSAEKKKAKDAMKKLGIDVLAKKCYRELSGGQQQRVLLARAICAAQKILFLDEPVTGLDPKVTEELYNLIENLNSNGLTVVMVSHDIEAAVKYASHILHISQNQYFYGKTQEYLNSKAYKLFNNEKGTNCYE
ncbi:Ferric enterobactin transport ATP-binding protein FepC [bioreactor metagenome]|uniref:Ferric enterobactin transport ATP-binding protein FepC n=1 Tax=bioreactor metagenome TaxID=1076179 RepID=A0A645CZ73_9ZZZZ|nr:metal ABC transporter ATP-binding protein [Lachnospiraceae bacterium]